MVTGGDGAAQVHLAHRATATGGGTALQETSVCTEHSVTLLFSQLLIWIVCVRECVIVGKKEQISSLVDMLCLYALVCIGEPHEITFTPKLKEKRNCFFILSILVHFKFLHAEYVTLSNHSVNSL